MTEEEKKEYTKNCYDGLNSLNIFIDALLADENFSGDEELKNTKKEVEQSISNLGNILDSSDSSKVKNK